MARKRVEVVVSGVNGIKLKPIRLRRSLYLLIPMEVAKLIGVTNRTRFVSTLKHGDENILMYAKIKIQIGSLSQEVRGVLREEGKKSIVYAKAFLSTC